MNLTFISPITGKTDVLIIEYPKIDYFSFKRTRDYNGDLDLIFILNDILKDLDCTVECNSYRLRMTNYPVYSMILSEYYFYLIRLNNQFTYNKYIDKVIKRHIDNIVFEHENPYVLPTDKKKSLNKKKPPVNKFIKQITHDLFTGKETYVYYNPYTKEEINSDNPTMLDELNNIKKKEHKKTVKTKQIGVPISAMTFNFKKDKK